MPATRASSAQNDTAQHWRFQWLTPKWIQCGCTSFRYDKSKSLRSSLSSLVLYGRTMFIGWIPALDNLVYLLSRTPHEEAIDYVLADFQQLCIHAARSRCQQLASTAHPCCASGPPDVVLHHSRKPFAVTMG
eukprot:357839-Chlamydomonas_euryale.AAC.9